MSSPSSPFQGFSLDLEMAARQELNFLKLVDEKGILYERDLIRYALYRYETLWLPFLKRTSAKGDESVVVQPSARKPPLDVRWVWHVHLLNPRMYESDCKRVLGASFSHVLTPSEGRSRDQTAWEREFPDEPFDLTLQIVEERRHVWDSWTSSFKYDIVEAALRQKVFYYQVSLPHFRDDVFLKEAVERYRNFFNLKGNHREAFLVPCYDVDLVWHAHQVNNKAYETDCLSALGFLLDHDDSVNDRSEGSKLNSSYENTIRLYQETYGGPYPKPGAMYRGTPPNGRLFPLSKELVNEYNRIQRYEVSISSLQVGAIAWPHLRDARLKLSLSTHRHGEAGEVEEFHSMLWSIGGPEPADFKLDHIITVKVTDNAAYKLLLDILKEKPTGVACCEGLKQSVLARVDLGFMPDLEDGRGVSLKATPCIENESLWTAPSRQQVDISMKASYCLLRGNVPLESFSLAIVPGSFYDAVMPENVESMWGPVPMRRLPEGQENECKAVVHR